MTHDANCPDAEALAAWYDHGLTPAEHARIESHVSMCDRCQAIVAMLARTDTPATVPASEGTWFSWRWFAPVFAAAAALVVFAVVRPVAPPIADQPAFLSARSEPRAATPVPERAPAPGVVEMRQPAPSQKSAVPAKPAAPAPAQPAESNEIRRDDKRANENVAAAPPATPPAAPPTASAAERAPAAGAPAAAARLMQANADAMIPLVEIGSPDPAIRWRIRGAIVERTVDAGATWTPQPTGASVPLAAGASPSADVCWIVGRNGTVLRTIDGRTWQTVAFPERTDLIRVEAASAASATVVAADARRFTTDDGGVTWKPGGLQEF